MGRELDDRVPGHFILAVKAASISQGKARHRTQAALSEAELSLSALPASPVLCTACSLGIGHWQHCEAQAALSRVKENCAERWGGRWCWQREQVICRAIANSTRGSKGARQCAPRTACSHESTLRSAEDRPD